ncbi:MAG: HAD hydrolase-like protein [bacterium]
MNVHHLFIDLDGTLTDPRNGIVDSITHALAVLGRPAAQPETLTRFIGPPLGRVFQILLATEDPEIIRSAIAAYREHFSSSGILEARPYPEIPSTLESLAALGRTLYIVTSKPRIFAERIVAHCALTKYFTSIYGPDLDEHDGDKAALIRRALSDERIDCRKVAMIGDRGEDIRGARANSVGAIGVTWGFGSREELQGADRIVDSPSELLALVSKD